MGMLGSEAAIYRNTGTSGSPTWSEITCVKDMTWDVPDTEVDMSTRASLRKKYRQGMTDLSLSGTLVQDKDDVNFVAIWDAKWARTTIEIAICDDDITTDGTNWLRCTVGVFGMSVSEPLDDEMTYDITFREDPDGTEYDIAEVAAS